jgi:transposase-like protein
MNVEQLRHTFPDEESCRAFFESIIWPEGPVCPHCQSRYVWRLQSTNVRAGLHECGDCHRQFTVTTRTPFHSTKLSLWTWIQVMYSLICSSKGASSVAISTWVGVSQKTAWKMLHALRALMAVHQSALPQLLGVVELDEKYIGGKPRYKHGVKNKRGHGTSKACIATVIQRQGPVRTTLIGNDSVADLKPFITEAVASSANLMSDEHSAYQIIGREFHSHQSVRHGQKEYARGDVHNNTAESFHSTLERAKVGVYHWMSKRHLPLYSAEAVFHWNQREPEEKTIQRGKNRGQKKVVMKRLPILEQFKTLLRLAPFCQVRRTENSSIRIIPGALPLFGL